MKTSFKNLRIYATHVLAKAYPSTLQYVWPDPNPSDSSFKFDFLLFVSSKYKPKSSIIFFNNIHFYTHSLEAFCASLFYTIVDLID